MSDLILVAASGLAREVLALLRSSGDGRRIQVVDDAPELWGTTIAGVPVTGGLEVVRDLTGHEVLICAGRGTARRAISGRLREMGVSPHRYTRVVHPSVDVPDNCEIGAGSVLLAHTALTSNVRLGEHVVVMPNTSLTHDDVVEDCATICAGVSLGGNVHVETGAYLGMNASVREGLRVGADSVLGMGAALVVDLPPGQVWGGNPASRLRTRAGT